MPSAETIPEAARAAAGLDIEAWREDRDMATRLEVRHGLHAVEVARFFVTRNELAGDLARAERWDAVAGRILLRQRLRQLEN